MCHIPPYQSMVFITILLFAVAYIFAIVGVVFFESYSIPDRPDLNYHHSFRCACEEAPIFNL